MKYLKIALLQVLLPTLLAVTIILGIGYVVVDTVGDKALVKQYCEKVIDGTK